MRTWRHHAPFRTASTASVCVLATGFAALAMNGQGYTTPQVQLNDSGVWVTKTDQDFAGRYNYDASSLDAYVDGKSSGIDVLQHDSLVILTNADTSSASLVDPATASFSGQAQLPTGAKLLLGGTTAAVVGGDGKVWAFPGSRLASFSADSSTPLPLVSGATASAQPTAASATLAPGGAPAAGSVLRDAVAVGTDGTVAVALPGQARVKRFTLGAAGVVGELPSQPLDGVAADDALTMTLVGTSVVVLDATTGTLHLPHGRTVTDPAFRRAVLQDPADASADVVLATSSGLESVGLDGSAPQVRTVRTGGRPVTPVVSQGCAYGAWDSGTVLRDCAGTVHDREQTLLASTHLRYRVNRGIVVLNDVATGGLWLAQDKYQQQDKWSQVIPQNQASGDQSNAADPTQQALKQRNLPDRPPVAKNDEFGVRPGRTTVLPVLANDSDPDGDVLTADIAANTTTAVGKVQRVLDGSALQVVVPPNATGSATFTYTADDGRGGTASATVKLTVHDPSQDQPPQPCPDVPAPTPSVRQGGQVSFGVLDNWIDPDGDPIYLKNATAQDPGDTVRFTADGTVTFIDDGKKTGATTITITVSDGRMDAPPALLNIQVISNDAKSTPLPVPDHAATVVGRAVTIRPLANDTDSAGAPLTLARVDADTAGGVTLKADYDAGVVTFTAAQVGSYYLTYTVSDGTNSALGLIRVDVTAPGDGTAAPIAVLDRALLPAGGSVLVDVLANDTDPSGGVLVVQSVSYDASTGLSVEVVDHAMLRVSDARAGTEPLTFTYTVSNGLASATGQVVVLPLPPIATMQPPITRPDDVTVRVGDVATVDVLANDTHPNGAQLTLSPKLTDLPPADQVLVVTSQQVVRVMGIVPGTYHATYTALDPQQNATSGLITIHVKAADAKDNSAPVPRAVVARTLAGTTIRIPIPVDGIDPDGDSVTLLGVASPPTKGLVSAVGNGWLDYQATDTAVGTDTFTYTVEDRYGAQATGTVTVGIAPKLGNHPPVTVKDAVTVVPGRTVAVAVLANDSDPDGDRLALDDAYLKAPDGVTAKDSSGVVVVTAPAKAGTYVLQYGASDGQVTTPGTLDLTVDPNAPKADPIARDDMLSLDDILNAGQNLISVPVLQNDEDPSGSPDDLTIISAGAPGRIDGNHVVVPLADDPQVVPYTIQNPDGNTATAFIHVPGLSTLRPALVSPLPTETVVSGSTLTIHLADVVRTPQNRPFTIAGTDAGDRATALNGTAAVVDAQTITFVASAGFVGAAAVTFQVKDSAAIDGQGLAAKLTLPITVTPGPDQELPPTFTPPTMQVPLGGQATATLVATDPNKGDTLTFSLGAVPAGFVAHLAGTTLTVTAAAGTAVGTTASLPVSVSDGKQSVTGNATLTAVSSDKPLATVQSFDIPNANAGTPVTQDLLAGSSDPFTDAPLTVDSVRVSTPTAGTAVLSGSTVTITPATGFHGSFVVSYSVSDKTKDPTRTVTGQVRLTVRAAPDAPGTPTVVTVSSQTAVISWAAPNNNGAPITDYQVAVNGPGSGNARGGCVQAGTTATTCTITGLTNTQQYTFSVKAQNAAGWSTASPDSAAITPDQRPDAPTAPTLAFGDSSLTVTWNPISYTDRSAITNLKLEISPAPASGSPIVPLAAGTTTYDWKGLANGTSYKVRLYAQNSTDWSDPGDWSQPMIPAGKPDAPGTPTAKLGDPVGAQRTLDVSWTAPGAFNGDSSVDYTLYVSQGSTQVNKVDAGTALSQAVTLNTSTDAYTFTVTATNKAGESAPSAASTPIRNVVPPGAVKNATVQATGSNGTLQLTFDTPDSLGGATTAEVRYQYQLNGGSWADLASNRQVVGLVNGGGYTAAVRAVSTVGGAQYAGPPTTAAAIGQNVAGGTTTRPYGPLANPSVNATSGSTYVTLSASATANGCGVTLHFQVDGGGWQTTGSSWSGNVGNGYSQGHSIAAYATDGCGNTTGTVYTSATSTPPPLSGYVSRGSSGIGVNGCTNASCAHLVLNVSNFPAGTYQIKCWGDDGGQSAYYTLNNIGVPANGSVELACVYGFPNNNVRVEVVGVYTTPWILWKNA